MSICTITENAKIQINKLCSEHEVFGISLNIKGGGCAGFEYDWGTVSNEQEVGPNDVVITTGTGNFIVGATSLMFLIGTQVDYLKSLTGSNFEISNPNAKSSCGCGVSVNFDMDNLPVIV